MSGLFPLIIFVYWKDVSHRGVFLNFEYYYKVWFFNYDLNLEFLTAIFFPYFMKRENNCPSGPYISNKEMATHSIFLPGESHGQRSLLGYSPWGRKESDTTERLHDH